MSRDNEKIKSIKNTIISDFLSENRNDKIDKKLERYLQKKAEAEKLKSR